MNEKRTALLAGKLQVKIVKDDSQENIKKFLTSLKRNLGDDGTHLTNIDFYFTLSKLEEFEKNYIYYQKDSSRLFELVNDTKPCPFTKVCTLDEYIQHMNEEEAIKEAEDAMKQSQDKIKEDLKEPENKTIAEQFIDDIIKELAEDVEKEVVKHLEERLEALMESMILFKEPQENLPEKALNPLAIERIKNGEAFVFNPYRDSHEDLKIVLKELGFKNKKERGFKIKDIDIETRFWISERGIEFIPFMNHDIVMQFRGVICDAKQIEEMIASQVEHVARLSKELTDELKQSTEKVKVYKQMLKGVRNV